MDIILYQMTCDAHVVNKTAYLTNQTTRYNCTFKEAVDITAPTLLMEVAASMVDYPYNYVYIPSVERYYFVYNRTRLTTTIFQLDLRVDVLMSYRIDFINNYAFIERNEFTYNAGILDPYAPMQKGSIVEIIDIENVTQDSLVNTTFNLSEIGTTWNTIVTTSDGSIQSPNDITSPVDVLPDLHRYYTPMLSNYFIFNLDNPDVQSYFRQSNVSGFVKGIFTYPCQLPFEDEPNPIIINEVVSTIPSHKPMFTPSYYMILSDFEIPYSDSFIDLEPISNYEMYIPFVGYVQLNAHDILGRRLLLIYQPNFEDGSAQVLLVAKDDNYIIYQSTCQLGVGLGLSTTNEIENKQARITNTLNLITGSIGSITSKGNSKGGLAMDVFSNVSNYIVNDIGNFVRGSAQVNGGVSGILSPLKPHIKKTKAVVSITYATADFNHLYGRPTQNILQLSSLRGFTKVGNIHLNAIPRATREEMLEIEQLLQSGVIL